MKELAVSGKVDGKEITVVAEYHRKRWHFTFNGEKDKILEARLRQLMKTRHAIGGTYLPKTQKLNISAILTESCLFFEPGTKHDIQCFGEIEKLPYEEGVIY